MLGLALEGGGAKGAFHMGAVKAFFEQGYSFEGVAGTSIGALNGAIIAQGDFEAGYRLWEGMDTSLLFDIDHTKLHKLMDKKIDRKTLVYLSAKIKDIIDNKGLDTKRIRETLDRIIDENKLRESKTGFGMVTVSLSDLKPVELYKEDVPEGKMTAYLMASANFPVFKIEPLDGKFFLDGGLYDNCPINLLVRKGYREIIAVRTLEMGVVRKVKDKKVKVTYIVPSEDVGSILNFDNEIIRINLKMGYYDAMRSIKGLKGRKYYIEPVADNNLFFNALLSLPEEAVFGIGEIMAFPQMDPRRLLLEKIVPGLSKMLDLPVASTYQDIVIGLLENIAEERKMDRYKILDFNSFLRGINGLKAEGKVTAGTLISGMAEKTKLASLFSKEIIFKKTAEELLKVLTA